jgi:RNA polymerase sigma-70 factor (ECF subfamily)
LELFSLRLQQQCVPNDFGDARSNPGRNPAAGMTNLEVASDQLGRAYKDSRSRLHALAVRYVGRDADDVVQETFVRALENRSKFRGEAATTTWLHRITVNVCISHCRKRGVRTRADLTASQRAVTLPISEDGMAVRQALASLKHIDRQVCLLHDVIGFTHHEIGAALRIPEGTSKSKLTSARRQLRGYVRFRSSMPHANQ